MGRSSLAGEEEDAQNGNWIAHTNTVLPGVSAPSLGVGLPNYVPSGHPSLREASINARSTYGDPSVHGLLAMVDGEAEEQSGLAGRPYVSQAERNIQASQMVSAASSLLSELARDKTYDEPTDSPANMSGITRHNRGASTMAGSRGNFNRSIGNAAMLAASAAASLKAAPVRPVGGGMPHFAVEHYMRSNHRMLSNADRLTATEVLKIEPFDRDPSHLSTLSKFLASIDFFSGLSDALRADIAGIATLRVLRKEEPVYSEGDEALMIYVVLSGSVGTRVKDYLGTISSSGSSNSSRLSSSLATSSGFIAATVRTGECFGQESMGTEERTLQRTQTKIALERTELLQVDMRDYKSILRISLSRESAAKMDFVALLPVFEMCTMRELHRIAMAMQIVHLPKNTVVMKQGEVADKVYFIQAGECRVIHKVYSKVVTKELPSLPGGGRSSSPSSHAGAHPNQLAGMSVRTGYGLYQPREGEESKSATTPVHERKGGGGAYKFARARAFEAARAVSRGLVQSQGAGGRAESHTATGKARPQWGQPATVESHSTAAPPPPRLVPLTKTVLQPQLLDLGRLSAKWFFGEYGVLTDQPRSASVYAETNVTLMVMTKEDFLQRLPPFCLKFIRDYIATFYAPEGVMKEQFQSQQRWEQFKAKMMQANGRTRFTAEVSRKFSSTLNAVKHSAQ
jgi:CRP-like cAMP-binding protein